MRRASDNGLDLGAPRDHSGNGVLVHHDGCAPTMKIFSANGTAQLAPLSECRTIRSEHFFQVGRRSAVFAGPTPNEHILRYPMLAFYFIAAAARSWSINTRFRLTPHLYPPSAPVPRMTR